MLPRQSRASGISAAADGSGVLAGAPGGWGLGGVTYYSLWAVKLSGFCRARVASESRLIAEEMLHTPIAQLPERSGTGRAADLRRYLIAPSRNMWRENCDGASLGTI